MIISSRVKQYNNVLNRISYCATLLFFFSFQYHIGKMCVYIYIYILNARLKQEDEAIDTRLGFSQFFFRAAHTLVLNERLNYTRPVCLSCVGFHSDRSRVAVARGEKFKTIPPARLRPITLLLHKDRNRRLVVKVKASAVTLRLLDAYSVNLSVIGYDFVVLIFLKCFFTSCINKLISVFPI